MGRLMSYFHRVLLRKGLLDKFMPDSDDTGEIERAEIEAVRVDIEARTQEEVAIRREVRVAVRRLQELNDKNHYGESLRRAFGGK